MKALESDTAGFKSQLFHLPAFVSLNKAKAEDGGVFVYKVDAGTRRPERKTDLYNYLAEGRTSSFNGVPNYTMDLHRTLFDSKNKLF